MSHLGLSRDRRFLTFWLGQTISAFGSQVTILALPLTAALILKANAAEMGLLTAAQTAPTLLLGLFAGVWVDRSRTRPILLAAALGRSLLLASIPLASVAGALTMAQLYGVGLLLGALTTLSGAAYSPFLLRIVPRDRLLEANRKLSLSGGAADLAGPGMAGVLVQFLTAPVAIAADALSFLVSALCLVLLRVDDPAPPPVERRHSVAQQIAEGLGFLANSRLLRAIAGTNGTWAFFDSVALAVLILYATRELHLSPALLGVAFIGAPVGFLLSSLLLPQLTSALGFGRAVAWAAVVGSAGGVLYALASGPRPLALLILFLAEFFMGLGGGLYSIATGSLQQVVTPDPLLGRMNAGMNVLSGGAAPIGAIIGGFLGVTIGLRPTLVVGAIGGVAGFLWVWFSPLRTLTEQPHYQPDLLGDV